MEAIDGDTKVKVYKVSELPIGEYKVLTYESKKSTYGKTYILSCTPNNGETIIWFWSNGYLADYIQNKPNKKFTIFIDANSKLTIINYSRITILS